MSFDITLKDLNFEIYWCKQEQSEQVESQDAHYIIIWYNSCEWSFFYFFRYCGRRYCWVDSNSDCITYYHSNIQKEVFLYSITLSLIVRDKFWLTSFAFVHINNIQSKLVVSISRLSRAFVSVPVKLPLT